MNRDRSPLVMRHAIPHSILCSELNYPLTASQKLLVMTIRKHRGLSAMERRLRFLRGLHLPRIRAAASFRE